MERLDIARDVRRRHVQDAIADERERARSVAAQLDELVAEVAGPELDRAVFAGMDPADVSLVRDVLGAEPVEVDRDELVFLDEEEGGEEESLDDEIVRLQAELELAERRIAALERYLEGLDAVQGAPAGG